MDIPRAANELTPLWLTNVLRAAGALPEGRVSTVTCERMSADYGYTGSVARLRLEYEGNADGKPATLIAKLPNENPRARAWGILYGAYEREVRFFMHFAKRCTIAIPRCYYAGASTSAGTRMRVPGRASARRIPGWIQPMLLPIALWASGRSRKRYALILEDLSHCSIGDQVAGAGLRSAEAIATSLAELHASFWMSRSLDEAMSWLPERIGGAGGASSRYRRNRRKFQQGLEQPPPAYFVPLMEWVDGNLHAIYRALSVHPHTLLHGDYRLDNLFFDGDRVWATDWDTVSKGHGVMDWAHFVVTSLSLDVDEDGESRLLKAYFEGLERNGVRDYDFETCRRTYVLAKMVSAHSLIGSPNWNVIRNERLETIFRQWHRRLFRRLPESGWDALLGW